MAVCTNTDNEVIGDSGSDPTGVTEAAPASARYWLGAASASLVNGHNLGALSAGLVTTAAGVPGSVANGTNGYVLTMVAGAPAWAAGAAGATPSDALPAAIGTAAAGVSALYSRGDHVHPFPAIAAASIWANVTGGSAVPSVLTASGDQVLRSNGGTLGFGGINGAHINTNQVTYNKLQQGGALSVLGVAGNATANLADITAGTDAHVLRRSGTTLGFGQVATGGIADDAVTYAKMQNSLGLSVVANATNALGDLGSLTAGGTLGEFLQVTAGPVLSWSKLVANNAAGTQTNGFVLTLSGGVPTWLAASGGVSGSGTATKLPVWTAGTTLGDSVITQVSTGGAAVNGTPVTPYTFSIFPTATFTNPTFYAEAALNSAAATYRAQSIDSNVISIFRATGSAFGSTLFGVSRNSITECFSDGGGMVLGTIGNHVLTIGTFNTRRVELTGSTGNIGLFAGATSYGSGSSVLFIGNAVTAPTSNPTGGFITYIDPTTGDWTARGPNGTITTIAFK